tara:strand:- start:59475 stop:60635 length:1161 start_codon:yes stop_codon:yes gene_type:complete
MTDVDPQAPPTPRSRLRPITQTELTELISGAMPYAVISLALLAILYTFYFATDLFLPIFIALFLSTILRPLVRHLCRIGLPASLAAALVLTVVIGTSVSATVNLSQPATEWVNRLPSLEREIRSKLWQVTESIEQAKQATEKIQKIAEVEDGKPPKSEVVVKGPSLLDKAFASTWLTFVQILIVIPLTFFFLSQDSTQTRRAISRIPWRAHQRSVEDLIDAVQQTVTRYLQISALIYLSLGIVTAILLYLLNMPNPVLWGALAALLGFIPYVGPMIVFCCISIVSLVTFDSWWQIGAPPLAYGLLTIVEGSFITPAILGRQLTISPIAIFLSMLVWTWVWGIPGALLSVPILVVMLTALRHLILIARDQPALRKEDESTSAAAQES